MHRQLQLIDPVSTSDVHEHVARVEVGLKTLTVQLSTKTSQRKARGRDPSSDVLTIPWSKPHGRVAREIIPPANVTAHGHTTDPSETRAKLLQAIAQGVSENLSKAM